MPTLEQRITSLAQRVGLAHKEVRTYALDVAEALQFPSFVPPVNYASAPPGLLGASANSYVVGSVNSQRFHPFMVGRAPWSCSGAVVEVTTAVSGGAGVTVTVALYAADPATGYPDTSTVLRTGSITPSVTGNRDVAWSVGAITLTPGIYWVSTIYTHTTAPSTYPALKCLNNVVWFVPVTTGPTSGVGRGLNLPGQSSPKSTATAPNGFSVSSGTDVPVVFLRRAA